MSLSFGDFVLKLPADNRHCNIVEHLITFPILSGNQHFHFHHNFHPFLMQLFLPPCIG